MTGTTESAVEPIRILVVDDHALFRGALRKLLESQAGLLVVGEASNAREAMDQLRKLKPQVLLLDLHMPQESGMEVLRRMAEARLETRAILLVASIEKDQIVEALRLGARGVMLKDTASQMLFRCIRAIMAGEHWINNEGISLLVNKIRAASDQAREVAQTGKFGLTVRELEILSTVTEGCTNKETAKKFSISEQTVKHHLTSIFEKVGVTNRLELALFAMNSRLTKTD
jgi:two-component system, NarL family, nitrate/nitrite response regulator NarL